MGGQPYRTSARDAPVPAALPRSVVAGLLVGAFCFGAFAAAAFVVGAIASFVPTFAMKLATSPPSALRVALLLPSLLLLAWRALPGTRSHVFARLALLGLAIDVAGSIYVAGGHTRAVFDDCGRLVQVTSDLHRAFAATKLAGNLLEWGGLALALLSATRPGLTAAVPSLVAATIAGTIDPPPLATDAPRLPGEWVVGLIPSAALAYATAFALFSYAFVSARRHVRHGRAGVREGRDGEDDVPIAREIALAGAWHASGLVLVAATSLAVSYAVESLTLVGSGARAYAYVVRSSTASATIAALLVAALSVWRRRGGGGSTPILVAASLATVLALVSTLFTDTALVALSRCGSMLWASTAIAGFGFFLPPPIEGFEKQTREVAVSIVVAGFLVGVAALVVATKGHVALHIVLSMTSAALLARAAARGRPLDHAAAVLRRARDAQSRTDVERG